MAAQQGTPGEGFPGGDLPGAGYPGVPGGPPTAHDPARPIYGDWVPPTAPPDPGAAAPTSPSHGTPPSPPYGAPTSPQYGAPTQPPYGVPTQPTYGVPTPPTFSTRRRRFKKRHGFLGLLVVLLIVILVQVLIAPWAFHIGGSFTPLGNWTGAAQGKAPNGDRYAVQLDLQMYLLNDHPCSQLGGCDDFHGTMTVCTKAGRYTLQNMSGKVGGWLSTDGQTMRFSFAPGRNNKDYHLLGQVIGDMQGVWHGKVYQATDEGYLERDFKPDGTPRSVVTSADPKQAVALAFQPGNFDAMCAALKPA